MSKDVHQGVMWTGSRLARAMQDLSRLEGHDVDYGANFNCDMTPGQPYEGLVQFPGPRAPQFRHASTRLDPEAGK